MADKRKTITISVQDDFSRQLKQFASLIDQSQDELDDFQSSAGSGKGARQMITNVRDMTLAFNGLVTMVGSVAQGIDEFAQLGTQTRRNKAAFEALSGSTKAYEANLKAVQTALKGTVTDSEAAAIGSNLLNLGLASSASEIENFTEIAATIGAMSPQINSTEEAISQIGLTIANMSFARLDALGLAVGDVRNRMKELQAETKGMTKEQAFNDAVMEGLAEKAAVLGDEFSEIGASQERMRARFRGFKEDIAEDVSESLDKAFVAGEQLGTILDQLGLKETIVTIAMEVTGIDEGSPEANLLNMLISGVTPDAAFIGDVAGGAVDLANQILGSGSSGGGESVVSESVLPAILNQQGFPVSVPGQGMSVIPQADQFSTTAPELPMSMAAAVTVIDAALADRLAKALEVGGLGEFESQGPGEGLLGEFAPSPLSFAGPVEAVEDFSKSEELIDAFGSAFNDLQGDVDQAAAAIVEITKEAETFGSLAEKFGLSRDQFDVDVLNEMNAALKEAGVDADIATAAIERYELATGLASGSSRVFEGHMTNLAESLAAGDISAEEFAAQAEALSELDFQNINEAVSGFIDEGSLEEVDGFIDSLINKDISQLEEILALFGPQELPPAQTAELKVGTDSEGVSFGDSIGAEEFSDNVKTATKESEEAVGGFVEFSLAEGEKLDNGYTVFMGSISSSAILAATDTETAFETASESIIEDIAVVDSTLNEMLTKQRQVSFTLTTTATTQTATTPAGTGPLPEFAEGGFTGTGTEPFAAMLHPNEIVVPLNKLPVGGGQNSNESIVVEVNLDGRQVESSVQNVKRLKNER